MASVAAVKIAQKQAHMPEAAYRDLLARQFSAGSCTYLTAEQRDKLVAAIHRWAGERPKSATERKIWALWYDLKPYLTPDQRTVDYLLAIDRRASGNDKITGLAALRDREEYKTIEALKRRVDQVAPVPF